MSARLLSKREVLAIIGFSYPTVWSWMRQGKFPRSRVVGGQSMWLSNEIETWLAALPVRQLKGDEPEALARAPRQRELNGSFLSRDASLPTQRLVARLPGRRESATEGLCLGVAPCP